VKINVTTDANTTLNQHQTSKRNNKPHIKATKHKAFKTS